MSSSHFIFTGLKITAWVIFVGLCINAGGLIINFVLSLIRPELVGNLYQQLDLRPLFAQSKSVFIGSYTFVLVIAALKANLFYVVIVLVSRVNLDKPFSRFAARQITRISFYTFSIGLLSIIAQQAVRNLQQRGYAVDALDQFWVDGQAFVLMAAIIYMIAVIFSKGVALQDENDLTV